MKKLVLVCLIASGFGGFANASDDTAHHHGAKRFIVNLNLDEAREAETLDILHSYKEIKHLAMSGQFAQIPQFIQQKEAELAQVLTDTELQKFKQNFSAWFEGKDFSKYQKYAEKNFSK